MELTEILKQMDNEQELKAQEWKQNRPIEEKINDWFFEKDGGEFYSILDKKIRLGEVKDDIINFAKCSCGQEFTDAEGVDSVVSTFIGRMWQMFEEEKQEPAYQSISEQLALLEETKKEEIKLAVVQKISRKGAGKRKAQRKVKFSFQLIQDNRLDIIDRIIYSLMWSWSRCEKKKGNEKKAFSIAKFRKFTGSSNKTIKYSINKLIDLEYVSKLHHPKVSKNKTAKGHYDLDNGMKRLGHIGAWEFINSGNLNFFVFAGVYCYNRHGNTDTAWLCSALGLSRATVKRYKTRLLQMSQADFDTQITPPKR